MHMFTALILVSILNMAYEVRMRVGKKAVRQARQFNIINLGLQI